MISKILVPTDGSRAARKAAMYAVDLAKQLKATVIVLSIIDKRSFMGQTVSRREDFKTCNRAYRGLSEGGCRRVCRRNKEALR